MATDKRPITAEDLFRFRLPGEAQISKDGTRVAFTLRQIDREKNRYESSIWVYDAGTGSTRRFTNGRSGEAKAKDHTPRWSPDGQSLSFVSDRSGTDQIWLIKWGGGEARQLTHGEPVFAPVWSPSGGHIAFIAKEQSAVGGNDARGEATGKPPDYRVISTFRYRVNGGGYQDGRPTQVFSVDVNTGNTKQITTGQYRSTAPDWSPDGSLVSFLSYRNPDWEFVPYEDLYTVSANGGEPTRLTNSNMSIHSYCWEPSGERFIVAGGLFPKPGGTVSLYRVSRQEPEPIRLAPDFDRSFGNSIGSDQQPPAGSAGPAIMPDGTILFIASDGGNSNVYRLGVGDNLPAKVTDRDPFVTASMSVTSDGSRMALIAGGPEAPLGVYYGAPGALVRVSGFNDDWLAERHVSTPERVKVNAGDGTELEGWFLKPYSYVPGVKYPLIMQIHGGPHSAYGNSFFHEFQCLVSLGFFVFFMNPRGSVGYGEQFAQAITGDWCGIDASDLMDGARFAASASFVEPSRIGVTGGSQGGYFTNWMIGHTDMFRAAVTQRSMSNLYSKYGTADNGVTHDKASMGGKDLWTDEDLIMERSPIRYARNVTTPLLILHSEEDYRCPIEQAEQWYTALKRLGRAPVEFIRFLGENHELSRSGKPSNRLERLRRLTGWFQKYLLG